MGKPLNRILFFLILVGVCAQQTVFADSALVQYSANGHSYQRIDTPMAWSDAGLYCANSGGHLATLTSQAENDFVFENVGQTGVNIWLGATDEISEGDWRWVTGETWSYTNWGPGQPDDGQPLGQDYLIFWDVAPGEWDDNGLPRGDFANAQFICEWEQQLSTPVPTIPVWGLLILSSLLGCLGFIRLNKQSAG